MFENDLKDARTLYDRGGPSSGTNMEMIAKSCWATFEEGRTGSGSSGGWESDDLTRLGEICRSTFIRLIEHQGGMHSAAVWRARSLALFAESGSKNGTAMAILSLALNAFSEGDSSGALTMLDVMEGMLQDEDKVITGDLVRSAVLENRAIVQVAREEWGPARESLTQVIELEKRQRPVGQRRMLKARAALATIDYAEGEVDTAIASLRVVVQQARDLGAAGIVSDRGDANLLMMQERVPWTELHQYQVI